jgi:nucleoside-diphosphate-sugar epimerase
VGEVINVGYGKGISIGELAKTIADLMGRDVKVVSDAKRVRPENSEVFKLVCANSKAKDLAGWQPSYSLKDGLKETIAFIETHMHLYKADSYNV